MLLWDGDPIVYRMGFALENEPEETVGLWVEGYLNEVTAYVKELLPVQALSLAEKSTFFLSPTGKNTFRHRLTSTYKENRVAPRPKHYDLIRAYLKAFESATIAEDQEADDAIGIAAFQNNLQVVVISIDKDLLQIPCYNYNPVKKVLTQVTELDATRFFYKQLLMGDAADNIKGCPNIGPVKADQVLGDLEWEHDMFWGVLDTYLSAKKLDDLSVSSILDEILLSGKLLKIRTVPEEVWSFPFDPTLLDLEQRRKQLQEGRKKNSKQSLIGIPLSKVPSKVESPAIEGSNQP
jgi:5'-3' exonuclease